MATIQWVVFRAKKRPELLGSGPHVSTSLGRQLSGIVPRPAKSPHNQRPVMQRNEGIFDLTKK
jgi:hypothetical protein